MLLYNERKKHFPFGPNFFQLDCMLLHIRAHNVVQEVKYCLSLEWKSPDCPLKSFISLIWFCVSLCLFLWQRILNASSLIKIAVCFPFISLSVCRYKNKYKCIYKHECLPVYLILFSFCFVSLWSTRLMTDK